MGDLAGASWPEPGAESPPPESERLFAIKGWGDQPAVWSGVAVVPTTLAMVSKSCSVWIGFET